MATEVHVNPNTVQRAYDELERAGLVYSQRGKGLFVAEQGAAFAQSLAGDGVRRAFDQAIRAGQVSGMKRRKLGNFPGGFAGLPVPGEGQGVRAVFFRISPSLKTGANTHEHSSKTVRPSSLSV